MTGRPLVLDADGTFLRTDLVLEGIWAGIGTDPVAVLRALARMSGPAAFKADIARIAPLRVDLLPLNAEAAALAVAAADAGRPVAILSGADRAAVAPLAAHYGFGRVFASGDGINMTGQARVDALIAAYGRGGYDYVGRDARVREHADHTAILGPDNGGARALIRAMRPHQWVKNVLLFLPMIAAHAFYLDTLLAVLIGIGAFSAAASCIYIVNDLLDLEADRRHALKCNRPFAAGTVPIGVGMVAALALGIVALGTAATLSWQMFGVTAFYIVLALAYSLRLKRMRWIDIAVLASLYTLRVVAGAVASDVVASVYMLVFVFPVFVTLGCVKRMAELAMARDDAPLPGRGYARRDRGDLLYMAVLGMIAALSIFFLYSFSDQARGLYPDRWLLWLALIPLAAWLCRMVRLGYLGRVDFDPIVFALRDVRGIGYLTIMLSLMFYAAGLWTVWARQIFG